MAVTAHTEQALLEFAIASELACGRDAIDASIDHDRDVVRDDARNANVLLDDEDVHVTVFAELLQHLLDLRHDDRREPFCRLVHDEEAWIGEQGARDSEHLLLTARELAAAIGFALGEPRERRIHALDRPGALAAFRDEAQMLINRQRGPQPATLRHISDTELGNVGGRETDELLATEADRSGCDRHETHDGLAERSLAHAIAADDRQDAALEAQIDTLQGVRGAVVDIEPANLEGRRAVALSHDHLRDKAPAPRRRSRSPRACPP